jgi:uncharacterized protein YcfJ
VLASEGVLVNKYIHTDFSEKQRKDLSVRGSKRIQPCWEGMPMTYTYARKSIRSNSSRYSTARKVITMRIYKWTAVLAISLSSSLQAQSYRGEGAGLGGLTGALIGGVIGHQNDEVAEGALIGGAVGAIAGGVIGNTRDQEIARQRYYQHQQWQYQNQLRYQEYVVQNQRSVSIADVVTMSRSGLSDAVIIGHVQNNGVQRRLEVSDIISLHQQGVSESVIHAMQNARIGGDEVYVASAPARAPNVIIREHYNVTPIYTPPAARAYYRYDYGPHWHWHHHGCW